MGTGKYYRVDKSKTENAMPYLVIGWICAVLSLIAFPFVFGIVGVTMGIISTKKESRVGMAVIIASIVFMLIGLIYSDVLMTYLRLFLNV